jgi:hypothetical protein
MVITQRRPSDINRLFGSAHTRSAAGAHHRRMQAIERQEPAEISAVATLRREIAELGSWLTAQGLDLHSDQARIDEGSRDRLYFSYGYFAGLKKALAALTSGGASIH